MRYLGGKARLARHLVPAMNVPFEATYVEPFVGGANVMSHQFHVRNRIGADANRYVVSLHNAIQSGWQPPAEDITREFYEEVRANRDSYPDHVVGYVGFGASMHGDFFRCFIGLAKDSRQTNHVTYAESCRNVLLRSRRKLEGVRFICSDYRELSIDDGAWVYCDPPYRGTAGYFTGPFDSDEFWAWASELKRRCRVFVSELEAPPGWDVVWSQERCRMGSGSARRKTVEKLFA